MQKTQTLKTNSTEDRETERLGITIEKSDIDTLIKHAIKHAIIGFEAPNCTLDRFYFRTKAIWLSQKWKKMKTHKLSHSVNTVSLLDIQRTAFGKY